jgi:hypothetical protein
VVGFIVVEVVVLVVDVVGLVVDVVGLVTIEHPVQETQLALDMAEHSLLTHFAPFQVQQ